LVEQQEAEKAAADSAAKAQKRQRPGGSAAKRAGGKPEDDLAAIMEGLMQQAQDTQNEMGTRLVQRMVDDIAQVPVHDLLLRTKEGLHAVLTVSSEFYSSATNEYLRAGEFRVVGKVTRVVTGDKSINLTRRTVLGVAGPDIAKEMIDSVKNDAVQLDVADPIVEAPAIQILPMAIFL